MTWADLHTESETFAGKAEIVLRNGAFDEAQRLYAQAAEAEEKAIEYLDKTKRRTLGVSAVSAAALWYKAKKYRRAQQVAYQWLNTDLLPEFAEEQLRDLLQSIWNETIRQKAGIMFAPGQVVISVKGGEVVRGGAPLDLIVEKVQIVQSLFYRTAEFLIGMPHRVKGAPSIEIQQMCRPWLFQTIPGSYQFAVAVQEPAQLDLFVAAKPKVHQVSVRLLEILRASIEDPETTLPQVVTDTQYRGTFLKLTRNLAPTGKTFHAMEVRSSEDIQPITLFPSARRTINEVLRRQSPYQIEQPELQAEVLTGVLRAVHLDRDWLEITVNQEPIRVDEVGEAMDDVIGPMVNRPVIVRAVREPKGRRLFRDIEPAD